MEHLLIQSGGEYLPFARGRIQALRIAGNSYAAEKHEIEGTQIRVQIVDEDEFIWIEGGVGSIGLDSGIVEMLTIVGQADPNAFKSGILHETTPVAQYNAPFVLPAPDAKMRLNPNEGSVGQLAGTVTRKNDFKGAVPINERIARSFSTKPELNTAEPPAWIYPDYEEALLQKKLMAYYCPASIFTGRCRLYVQALYGQYRYTETGGTIPGDNAVSLDFDSVANGATPSIFISNFEKTQPIRISTSSGVFFNETTGEHWLLNPTGTGVQCYPLKSSTTGEAWRSKLKPGVLNPEDSRHLEAYILSQSRPSTAGMQFAVAPDQPDAYGMGYGWHWATNGLVADIVVTGTAKIDNSDGRPNAPLCCVSRHYRLQMLLSAEGAWTAGCSTISGPSKWTALRGIVTVGEPQWITRTLTKTVPHPSEWFACDATFYAFYVGNTLKTCQISVFKVAKLEAEYRADPIIYDSRTSDGLGFFNDKRTLGMFGGEDEFTGEVAEHFQVMITCGGVQHGPFITGSASRLGLQTEIVNKVEVVPGLDTEDGVYGPFHNNDGHYTGYPPGLTNADWEFHVDSPVADGIRHGTTALNRGQYTKAAHIDYDYNRYWFQDHWGLLTIVVIPIGDAEAVYLRSNYRLLRQDYETMIDRRSNGNMVIVTQDRDATTTYVYDAGRDEWSPTGTTYEWGYVNKQYFWVNNDVSTIIESVAGVNRDLVIPLFDEGKVICRAGVLDTKEYELVFSFRTFADDEIPDPFITLTADSGRALVGDPQKIDPHGAPSGIARPALVGWT